MLKKKHIYFSIFIILIVSYIFMYKVKDSSVEKNKGHQSIYNAYPTRLYYKGKKIDTTYIWFYSSYIELYTLEKMGFSVVYDLIDPVKTFGVGKYNPYDMYGTITISDGKDTVVIKQDLETNGVQEVFKNGEKIQMTINFLTQQSVNSDIERFAESQYVRKDDDLTIYLEEDKTYINLKKILSLFDNYSIEYNELNGYVYVKKI